METSKKKELLPDIIAHQERMRQQIENLNSHLAAFEGQWALPSGSEAEIKKPEELSTVEEIYDGMRGLEDGFNKAILKLGDIRRRYLGDV